MPLVLVPFDVNVARQEPHVRRFLRSATRRVERFRSLFRVPAFVSSDFALAYAALCQLEASGLAAGDRFGEWGSGLGVISCLAAMAGFRAHGFEVENRLVQAARLLAADFDLPAEHRASILGLLHGYAGVAVRDYDELGCGRAPPTSSDGPASR